MNLPETLSRNGARAACSDAFALLASNLRLHGDRPGRGSALDVLDLVQRQPHGPRGLSTI